MEILLMQCSKILRLVALVPVLGLLGFAEVSAEEAKNRRINTVEEYLQLHHVPWNDVVRSYIQGDYITFNGKPFFVKNVELTDLENFSLAQEISLKQKEKLDVIGQQAPQLLSILAPMVMQEYAGTATSSTSKNFKNFMHALDGTKETFKNPVDPIIKLDTLNYYRKPLKESTVSTFEYATSNLWSDLYANSSTLLTSAALHFAISGFSDLISSHVDEQMRTTYCYSTRPNGLNYILEIQAPNEQEIFLFKGIDLYGRIDHKDFSSLEKQGCAEVGGKVIPRRTKLGYARDAFAFTLGKTVEITVDAAIAMTGQHVSLANKLKDDWKIAPQISKSTTSFNIVPDRPDPGFIGNALSGVLGFGSIFLKGIGSVLYLSAKQTIKEMVVAKYRKHFPKYNLKEVEPKEQPLGIASVNKEFRYVYLNHENEQCQIKGPEADFISTVTTTANQSTI